MTREAKTRLKGLLSGEWMTQGQTAERLFKPPQRLLAGLFTKDRITSADLRKAEHAFVPLKRRKKLQHILRAHWKSELGVTDPDEIEIRDSFDELLTTLQILELSVESGYLTEDDVIGVAREQLLRALWSQAACSFVDHYDYLAVRFLAARCRVDLGLPEVVPPTTDPRAAVQFATFLSQHQAWYGQEGLDWWLGLLDDYTEDDEDFEEDEAFYTFLRSGRLPSESKDVEVRFFDRADGLKRFIFLLSSLFSILPENVAPLYGTFYLYWMAKFFGYELGERGYRRESELYYDWSRVAPGPILCPYGKPQLKIVREQLDTIRMGFKTTKAFVERHI
jgi:hypothetical protein